MGLAWFAASCTEKGPEVVSSKVFALNPADYLAKKDLLFLRGKVLTPSKASVTFILEDESGRVLVSTENLSERFTCPEGADVLIEGRLKSSRVAGHVHFSMTRLHECVVPKSQQLRK
jgi:hypothetical protein